MGHYLAANDVRERFAEPLSGLATGFADLCKRWERARRSGQIARSDLLLNDVLPQAALGQLRKLLREASGKLEDAIAGVYRYRKVEAKRTKRGQAGHPGYPLAGRGSGARGQGTRGRRR
ncbi:MAG: hypothetical protein ABR915_04075 [Thermoguttaceae bacterium]